MRGGDDGSNCLSDGGEGEGEGEGEFDISGKSCPPRLVRVRCCGLDPYAEVYLFC
jgi:hypothetical protein